MYKVGDKLETLFFGRKVVFIVHHISKGKISNETYYWADQSHCYNEKNCQLSTSNITGIINPYKESIESKIAKRVTVVPAENGKAGGVFVNEKYRE